MRKGLSLLLLIANSLWLTASSQSIGLGTTTPHSSALLDLESADKGLLVPRMSTSQRNAIANPAKGLMVYVTDDSSFYFYHTAWHKLIPSGEVWSVKGNSGTDTSVHFIGTVDNKPVKFRVNNNLRMQLDGFGRLQLYSPGNNMFIGYNAGINTSTGTDNHFTGYSAGQSNTTGFNNQFVGLAAGYNNTSGSRNHFTGFWAGVNNTTGSDNYFNGFSAGSSNLSGSKNTLVGNFTNVTDNNLVNAGAIGYNALVSQSNSFVIGGTGPDAVNVGIGTTAPAAKLDIQSGAAGNVAAFRTTASQGQIFVTQGTYTTYLGSNTSGGYTGTSSGDFAIRTGASDRIFLQHSTGRVGIGTNIPSEALHVAGNIVVDGIIPNQAFQTATLQGTWYNYGGGYSNAAYYKDKEGRVHLRGAVSVATPVTTNTIFILPVGYRPSTSGTLIFSAHFFSGTSCVLIYPDGRVEMSCSYPDGLLSFDGISFRAD